MSHTASATTMTAHMIQMAVADAVMLSRLPTDRGLTRPGKHGKPLPDADAAIRELGGVRDIRVQVATPGHVPPAQRARPAGTWQPPSYEPGSMAATRTAFGEALAALGAAR